MNKTKKRRTRCDECDELYKEEKITMLYHFKTELKVAQHHIRKFENDYDIEEHLDYAKPYGYVYDWCRDYYAIWLNYWHCSCWYW